MNSGIYPPSEDSFFLAEFVKKKISKTKPQKILDMGSGSGIQAESAIKAGANIKSITLADIHPAAIKHLAKKFSGSKIIKSDLFENITDRFGLIIFNPPYLPEDKHDAGLDTTGGRKGSETINRFLGQAKAHLNPDGKILILTSSFTKGIIWKGYKKKLLGKKKLFFEELYVWELRLG